MTIKFAVKGKEFSIKKVNGMSNLQLYYKMGIAEIVSFTASLIVAMLLLNEISIPFAIKVCGALLIFVILAGFFIVELKRTCIENASKMIKGGML